LQTIVKECRETVYEDIMKKSDKQKGKNAVANRKKQYIRYAVAAAAVIVILVVAGFYLFNPPVAKDGDTVMVYYTGSFENGTVFDSNTDGDPFIFTIGNSSLIAGFEEAVIGMTVNSTKTVNIPADKAYGPHLASLVHVVNRSDLPEDMEPQVGKFYTLSRSADGAVARVRIVNVTSDTVTIDENHLLVGQNVIFTIQFVGFYTN
jgi:peptidylprolyl isomerase